MQKQQIKVDLDEAEAGMTLIEPVRDGKGDILLPTGTVLTEMSLKSLRRRGIDFIVIVNDAISEEERQHERERIQKRLNSLFRKNKTGDIAEMLLQTVLAYRMGDVS